MTRLEALTNPDLLLGELQRENDYLRSILDALPAGIYATDAEGRITYFNKAAAELAGAPPVLGTAKWSILKQLYDCDGNPLAADEFPIAKALKSHEPVRGQDVLAERPDGVRVPLLPFPTPLFDASGKLSGAVDMLVDITDRKRAEEALRHNEERLRLATQTGKVGLWEWDIQANRISWTDSLYALHGLKRDEFAATVESFSSLVHPDDRERVAAALKRTLSDDAPYELEFRAVRPDGEIVWLYSNAIVVRDGGTPARLVGATFDITDRVLAEQALKESEARERAHAAQVEAIMEAVPAALWIAHDPDCRTITGNRMSYEFLRMKPFSNVSLTADADERPEHFEVICGGRPLPAEELPVQRAARGDTIRDFEEEIRFSDGASRYLFGNATPLRDGSGKLWGAVSAFVDITERKHAEAQRDLLLAELSHRVKNTLATVISIAHQSFAKGPSFDESRRSFELRIRALAQTHVRLSDSNWSGVSIDRILQEETAPYRRDDGSNVHISGPDIVLNAKSAVTLGMAFHELATNAAKYGALSVKEGMVNAHWEIDADRQVLISWTETNGPPVALPTRSGFGRLLLERVLTSDLNGTVDLDFLPEGFRCAITFSLDRYVARLA